MTKKEVFESYEEFIFQNYTRVPVVLVKGKGSVVTDIDGKKYLDFFPGWGVSNVGHCHPKVVAAVRDQIGRMIHVSNNFFHPNQARLARELVRASFPGKVFFCNSGAEANEAAIKFARLHGDGKRFEIITTEGSFHGRTMGALTATGQPKHHKPFQPVVPGFKLVPFNDIAAVKNVISDQTAAVLLELVQGEGGINVASREYVTALRALCTEKNILLMVDEVQTGFGRTGEMFAYQHYGIIPDVMTMAKGLGGGLPIGAMMARKELAHLLKPGMHGSTFGGSPIVTKAALGVFTAISKDKMLRTAKERGALLIKGLQALQKKFSCMTQVRGLGLMVGVQLSIEGKPIVEECLRNGLIINCTQGTVLRIMPALNVSEKQIKSALGILEKALEATAGTNR